MATLLFANNANSTLAGAITNTAISLNVQAGAGALFPNPGAGQYFVASLLDAATQTVREIIWVTARSGDVFTVVRAQENTSAQNWLAGDFIMHGPTAGQMTSLQTQSSGSTAVATSLIYYGIDTGVADSMVVTTNPTIATYTDGMVFEVTPAATNLTSTPQINICSLGAKQFSNALPGYIVAGQKFYFSYDGTLGKMVLTTLANTATQTMRGIGRTATLAEAEAGATAGSTPAWMTPEDVAAYVLDNPSALPVATTTSRGITRLATIAEAEAGVTGPGSVPACITPEDLAAALANNSGPVPIGSSVSFFESSTGMVPGYMRDTLGATFVSTSGNIACNLGSMSLSPSQLPSGQTWTVVFATQHQLLPVALGGGGYSYLFLLSTCLMRTA